MPNIVEGTLLNKAALGVLVVTGLLALGLAFDFNVWTMLFAANPLLGWGVVIAQVGSAGVIAYDQFS